MLGEIKCLVFSGGGIKGLSYVGCLRSLEERNLMGGIECLVGTSAGSLFAFLINIGYTSEELRDIVLNLDFNQMRDITGTTILNYFKSFGFDSGNRVERIVRIFLKKKLEVDDISFGDLFKQTGQRLIITGTCLNTCNIVNFSHRTHPDFSVIDAVRLSISVPFVFNACKHGDKLYVDGGIGSNYSLDAYHPYQNILGFLLRDDKSFREIDSFEDYTISIVRTIDRRLNNLYMQMYPDITVCLKTNVNVLDFNIKAEAIQELIQGGHQATGNYLDTHPQRLNSKDCVLGEGTSLPIPEGDDVETGDVVSGDETSGDETSGNGTSDGTTKEYGENSTRSIQTTMASVLEQLLRKVTS